VSFFAGWLTAELALHHIAWQVLMTVVFTWAGALRAWPGILGLVVSMISWIGLALCYRDAREAEDVVERALRDGLGANYEEKIAPEIRARISPQIDWKQIALPVPVRHRDVERLRNIVYARVAGLNLKLDVYRNRASPPGCPTLLQVHGGGWVIGSKNEQGLPLMLHLAARNWVCVSVNYRLSPHATFPDHLLDLKRAVAWIREHGHEYGADPDFMVVTGGSAGGHLAALLALTANDRAYQPGFEQVDTSVRGCVAFYGVYDFTNRHGAWHHTALHKLLERHVMKASFEEAPEAYEKASPISCIHPGAPPFLVIHGNRDTLAPVEEARRFCEAFRSRGHGKIAYAEIPGAQHAFEIFHSRRALLVIRGVERFLSHLHGEYVRASASAPAGQAHPV
jgi:acetyl esterase/lipase